MDLSLEYYPTPDGFSHYLAWEMDQHDVIVTGDAYEPMVGDGAIVRAFPELQWRTNDLDPRWPATTHLDATRLEAWEPCDWVITNPANTCAFAAVDLALRFARVGVIMHLRASVHEVLRTGSRRTWFRDHRPTGILWLPRFAYQRSKSTGKWTTDSVCACWVIWLNNYPGQFIDYAPEWVIDELDAETPNYRRRMDAAMESPQ